MSTGRLFDDPALLSPAEATEPTEPTAAPRLRMANRRQVQLRPVDLESLLAPEHDARAMWARLERLDLASFYDGIKARGSVAGRASSGCPPHSGR